LKFEFTSIPCHGTLTVTFVDPSNGDKIVKRIPCPGVMTPQIREIANGIIEVRWVCSKCGSIKGAIIGGGF